MNAPVPRIYAYSDPSRIGVYPVTVADIGVHVKIDADGLDAEYDYIQFLIHAATIAAEQWTGRTFVDSDYIAYLDSFCIDKYTIRRGPLIAIEKIEYYKDDSLTEIDSSKYRATASPNYSIVYPVNSWPYDNDDRLQSVKFSFSAGYVDIDTEKSVSSLSASGELATAVSVAHGFKTGYKIAMAGVVEDGYNGNQKITVVDSDTFAYPVISGLDTPATGTITATHSVSNVPDDIKEAIKQHVASMWSKRGDCSQDMVGTSGSAIASGTLPQYSINIYTLNRVLEIYQGA